MEHLSASSAILPSSGNTWNHLPWRSPCWRINTHRVVLGSRASLSSSSTCREQPRQQARLSSWTRRPSCRQATRGSTSAGMSPTVCNALWTTSLTSLSRLSCVAETSTITTVGLSARLQELGLPGWLLHSDLTNAYDSIDRGWLARCMTPMGLKESGVTLVILLQPAMAYLHQLRSAGRIAGFTLSSVVAPLRAGVWLARTCSPHAPRHDR